MYYKNYAFILRLCLNLLRHLSDAQFAHLSLGTITCENEGEGLFRSIIKFTAHAIILLSKKALAYKAVVALLISKRSSLQHDMT